MVGSADLACVANKGTAYLSATGLSPKSEGHRQPPVVIIWFLACSWREKQSGIGRNREVKCNKALTNHIILTAIAVTACCLSPHGVEEGPTCLSRLISKTPKYGSDAWCLSQFDCRNQTNLSLHIFRINSFNLSPNLWHLMELLASVHHFWSSHSPFLFFKNHLLVFLLHFCTHRQLFFYFL